MSNHTYFLRAASNHRFEENCFRRSQMEPESNRVLIGQEDEDLANCLVLLSNNAFSLASISHHDKYEEKFKEVEKKGNNYKFQCKTCNKIFDSHQALGGHRASHKKVKGCFASTNFNDTVDEFSMRGLKTDVSVPRNIKRKRSKAHECSICHRIFASGQALGGHKRCHWISPVSNFPTKTGTTSLANFCDEIRFDDGEKLEEPEFRNCEAFDLNLLPMVKGDDDEEEEEEEEELLKFEDENCKKQNMKKLKRMSDLDEGGSTSWLQMGISSSSTLGGTSHSS